MSELGDIYKALKAEAQHDRLIRCADRLLDEGYIFEIPDKTKIVIDLPAGFVTFYPHTGWFTSKLFKDGRGFKLLMKRLEKATKI